MNLQVNIFKDAIDTQRIAAQAERAVKAEVEKRYMDVGLTFPPDWLISGWGGIKTEAGIAITPITAFQCNTFLACVDLISSSIASLPLHVFKRDINDQNRESHTVAYNHPIYSLLHEEPNEEMTSHTALKTLMVHCLAWSNCYQEMQRDAGGNVVALWPRNPSATRPRRYATAVTLPPTAWRPYPIHCDPYELLYETADPIDNYDFAEFGVLKNGVGRLVQAADMIHIPGLSFDGRLGTSVTWLAREILAQSLATVKYSSKYFANYAKPQGILEVPQQSQQDRDRTKAAWMEAQSGSAQHSVAVLPLGVKWTALSNNPSDSQAKELMEHLRTEVAAFFHVPARMVGDNSKASRGTTEQENQEYLTYTLWSWLNAIQKEYKRKLFPHKGVGRTPVNPYYAKFDTYDMLRPDAASRTAYYVAGRQWGWLSANAVLAKEKENPINEEWADQHLQAVNMAIAETGEAPQQPADSDTNSETEKKPDEA